MKRGRKNGKDTGCPLSTGYLAAKHERTWIMFRQVIVFRQGSCSGKWISIDNSE